MDALEELIGSRAPVIVHGQSASNVSGTLREGVSGTLRDGNLRGGLNRVRGTGLAMLRGWHLAPRASRVTIAAIPQRAIRIQRLVLPAADAANWIVHNVLIPPRVGVLGSQPLPGAVFSAASPEQLDLELGVIAAGTRIEVEVEYVGNDPAGEVFRGLLMGQSQVEGGRSAMLPLNSAGPIKAGGGRDVSILLDDQVYRFEGFERLERVVLAMRIPGMPGVPEALGLEVQPRMVSLHLIDIPILGDGAGEHELVLIGIDDATSRVVFEIGDTLHARSLDPVSGIANEMPRLAFQPKCDLAGYIPTWWDRAQLLDWDLRQPFGPPTGAG